MKLMAVLLVLTLALPTMSLAKEGRYQAVAVSNGNILIIDTRTGDVVKKCTPGGTCRAL